MQPMKVEKGNVNYSDINKNDSYEITKSSLLNSIRDENAIVQKISGLLQQSGLSALSKISSLKEVHEFVRNLTVIVKATFEGKEQEIALNLIYASFSAVVASTINIDYRHFFESACGIKLTTIETDELVFNTLGIQTELGTIFDRRSCQKFLKDFNNESATNSFVSFFGKTHIRSGIKEFFANIKPDFSTQPKHNNQPNNFHYIHNEKHYLVEKPPKNHQLEKKNLQEVKIKQVEKPLQKHEKLNPINQKIHNVIEWGRDALEQDNIFFKVGINNLSKGNIYKNTHEFKMYLMQLPLNRKQNQEQIEELYRQMPFQSDSYDSEVKIISDKIYETYQEKSIQQMLPKSSQYKGYNAKLEDIIVDYIEYLTLYAIHFPADNIVSEILSGNGSPTRGSKKFKLDYPGKSLLKALQEKKLNNQEAYEFTKKYMADALLSGNHMAELGFFNNFLYSTCGVPPEFTNLVCSGTFNHYFVLTGGPGDTPGYYKYKDLPKEYKQYNGNMLINCCGYLSRWAAAKIWLDMYNNKQCPKELLELKEKIADPIKNAYEKREQQIKEFEAEFILA